PIMNIDLGPGLSLVLRGAARDRAPRVDIAERSRDHGPGVHRALLCAACRHHVTTDREPIQMLDRHEHTSTNPHGIAYLVGCFRRAPGCAGVGPRDSAFSWFPGYTWQIALCQRCRAHLGWIFRAGADSFHGLILDRLVTDPP